MARWLCLLRGHQRTPVVFATNRFYCRRCGIDLGPDPTPDPPAEPAAASRAAPERLAMAADSVAIRGKSNGQSRRVRPRERTRRSALSAGVSNQAEKARF